MCAALGDELVWEVLRRLQPEERCDVMLSTPDLLSPPHGAAADARWVLTGRPAPLAAAPACRRWVAPVCRRWADMVRQSHRSLFLECHVMRQENKGWWEVPAQVSSLLAAVAARWQHLTTLHVTQPGPDGDCWGILGFFLLGGMPALTTVELVGDHGPPPVGARCQPNGLDGMQVATTHAAPCIDASPLMPCMRHACCFACTIADAVCSAPAAPAEPVPHHQLAS
jgi:hypothetical protein